MQVAVAPVVDKRLVAVAPVVDKRLVAVVDIAVVPPVAAWPAA